MRRGLALLCLLLLAAPAAAQEREVPYWASLRAGEVNMRVGPSENFPIDWVYRRQGLPVKVLRVNQGWRLVEDPEGTRGSGFGRARAVARGARRGRRDRRLRRRLVQVRGRIAQGLDPREAAVGRG